MKFYYRIMGKHGTYVFTKKELERALDRENFGVKGEVLPEGNFAEITDEWYQADLTEGIRACEDVLKEPHALRNKSRNFRREKTLSHGRAGPKNYET